jgi:hypothetical protein
MSVTATLAGEFTKLLIRQHGSRLVGQDFWNLLVRHLGEVERAYEACERTPEGHVPPDESEDHEEFLGSEAYVVAGAMAETLAELLGAEEEDCRIDRNGFCQSHTSKPPCIVAEARALLDRWEEVTGG